MAQEERSVDTLANQLELNLYNQISEAHDRLESLVGALPYDSDSAADARELLRQIHLPFRMAISERVRELGGGSARMRRSR